MSAAIITINMEERYKREEMNKLYNKQQIYHAIQKHSGNFLVYIRINSDSVVDIYLDGNMSMHKFAALLRNVYLWVKSEGSPKINYLEPVQIIRAKRKWDHIRNICPEEYTNTPLIYLLTRTETTTNNDQQQQE